MCESVCVNCGHLPVICACCLKKDLAQAKQEFCDKARLLIVKHEKCKQHHKVDEFVFSCLDVVLSDFSKLERGLKGRERKPNCAICDKQMHMEGGKLWCECEEKYKI